MPNTSINNYDQDVIKSLNWREHIRSRPGMYIGKLGTGSESDDGIYILIKEIIDNAIDEFIMGFGKKVLIEISDKKVTVRDFGRGIPLEKVFDCVAQINTGGKYGSKAFKRSVGLNGVGLKAVNALSSEFVVCSNRNGQHKTLEFNRGELVLDHKIKETSDRDGTMISFVGDQQIFRDFIINIEYVEDLVRNYSYLNTGLCLILNKTKYISQLGLKDFLRTKFVGDFQLYPIVYLKNSDIEIALTHIDNQNGEIIYGFVNGQYTQMGGTHVQGFREIFIATIRNFFKKKFDTQDIKNGLLCALSIRINEPVFESQTKTKLGSTEISGLNISLKAWIADFLSKQLEIFLHKNPKIAQIILAKIKRSQAQRSEISKLTKATKDRIARSQMFNKKLRDCKVHYNTAHKHRTQSMIFITEGDSASGSITKSRDPRYQAVFSLRGKPMNCYGYSKKLLYQNEELYLLISACGLSDDLCSLRYNKIVMATDADVDGMHIRLLLMTFFLNFFPEVISNSHLYVLDTPLYRVRNKNKTVYCYNDRHKQLTQKQLVNSEVTRFKGLGEISPDEFGLFIGADIKLSQVNFANRDNPPDLLRFYMGANSDSRKNFIINNLS